VLLVTGKTLLNPDILQNISLYFYISRSDTCGKSIEEPFHGIGGCISPIDRIMQAIISNKILLFHAPVISPYLHTIAVISHLTVQPGFNPNYYELQRPYNEGPHLSLRSLGVEM